MSELRWDAVILAAIRTHKKEPVTFMGGKTGVRPERSPCVRKRRLRTSLRDTVARETRVAGLDAAAVIVPPLRPRPRG